MKLYRPNPPPARHGVGASCVVLPAGPWATVLEFLVLRFPGVTPAEWQTRLQQGDVMDAQGRMLSVDTPFSAGLDAERTGFEMVQLGTPPPQSTVTVFVVTHVTASPT